MQVELLVANDSQSHNRNNIDNAADLISSCLCILTANMCLIFCTINLPPSSKENHSVQLCHSHWYHKLWANMHPARMLWFDFPELVLKFLEFGIHHLANVFHFRTQFRQAHRLPSVSVYFPTALAIRVLMIRTARISSLVLLPLLGDNVVHLSSNAVRTKITQAHQTRPSDPVR